MTRHANTPSWLLLERYALGELPVDQRAEVDRVLAEDPSARDCLAAIRSDARLLPPLPPLVKPASTQPWWRVMSTWRLGMVTAAVVGVTVALLMPRAPTDRNGTMTGVQGAKGEQVLLSLVRERGGAVVFDPGQFAVTDRFKVRVTCAASAPRVAKVAVYQDGEVSHPLAAQTIVCGNLVVLDGAFRIDAAHPAEVCVAVGDDEQRAAEVLSEHPSSHPHLACVAMMPIEK